MRSTPRGCASATTSDMATIATVTEDDLDDLLPLVRGYLTFYEVDPPDSEVLALSRIAVMNDLFVDPSARGIGLADELINACVARCRERGDITSLGWQTAKDNHRAQAVYDRVGGLPEEWLDYSLPTSSA